MSPEGARPLPPTAHLAPLGQPKISCFYVFCCISATRGSQNHVFLRILLHLGPVGEPKSRIFTYIAASGPPWATQVVCFCIFCCMGACIWLRRRCLGHPGNSWGLSGCAAGRSGALLGTLGHPLGRPWDHPGHLRGPLEPSLGPFWCLLDSLGPSL